MSSLANLIVTRSKVFLFVSLDSDLAYEDPFWPPRIRGTQIRLDVSR